MRKNKWPGFSESKTNMFFNVRYGEFPEQHTHENFWEFILVESGEILHKINGKEIVIPSGTLCLLKPTDCHSTHEKTAPASYITLCVKCKFFESFMQNSEFNLTDKFNTANDIYFPVSLSKSKSFTKLKDKILISSAELHQQNVYILFLALFTEVSNYLVNMSDETQKCY